MKKKLFWGGMLMSAALTFSSCDKELDSANENYQLSEDGDEYLVPFFEVAKGDSISKDIYRAKPYAEGEDGNEIVSSDDENSSAALRAVSSGTGTLKFIIGLQARSFNSAAEAPSYYLSIPYNRSEPYYYYKLNYDLNTGAGGKFIYFYYCPQYLESEEHYNVLKRTNSLLTAFASYSNKKRGNYLSKLPKGWHIEGTNGCKGQQISDIENLYKNWSNFYLGTGQQVDLNEGAGGKFVYLFATSNYYQGYTPITTVAVSNSRNLSGYVRGSGDLNDGAGGKYIYLQEKHK